MYFTHVSLFQSVRIKVKTTHDVMNLMPSEAEYLPECILDPLKSPRVPGNYLDCLTKVNFVRQEVDCCRVDDVLQCCDKAEIDRSKNGYDTLHQE